MNILKRKPKTRTMIIPRMCTNPKCPHCGEIVDHRSTMSGREETIACCTCGNSQTYTVR